MAKVVKVYDPTEVERQIHFYLREHQAPGLLRFLASLPYGAEAAFMRGVAQLWVQQNAGAADIDARVQQVIEAGGGLERSGKVAVRKPRGRAAQAQRVRLSQLPVHAPLQTAKWEPVYAPSAPAPMAESAVTPTLPQGAKAASDPAPPLQLPAGAAVEELTDQGLDLLDQMSSWAG